MDSAERLERMLDSLCDTSGMTDAEVRADLEADGIDVDASQARFEAWLDTALAARQRRLVPVCSDSDDD